MNVIGVLFLPAVIFIAFVMVMDFAEDFIVYLVEGFADLGRVVVGFLRRGFGA